MPLLQRVVECPTHESNEEPSPSLPSPPLQLGMKQTLLTANLAMKHDHRYHLFGLAY